MVILRNIFWFKSKPKLEQEPKSIFWIGRDIWFSVAQFVIMLTVAIIFKNVESFCMVNMAYWLFRNMLGDSFHFEKTLKGHIFCTIVTLSLFIPPQFLAPMIALAVGFMYAVLFWGLQKLRTK